MGRGSQCFYLWLSLPVPLLSPRIGMIMVAALLPEARAVAFHEFQAIEPFGALVEVEFRDDQADGAAMFNFKVLPVVSDGNQHIVVIQVF